MGIHVFKVCSCILDQSNRKATQSTERVSMGARLTQQCLPVSERHCAVWGEEKKVGIQRSKQEEWYPVLLGGTGALMLLGLCCREALPGVASVLLLAAMHSDKEEN